MITRTTAVRWCKFNAVGAAGIAVQLITLAVLKTGLHLDYSVATALAVEAAVLHNFFWHERYTWADRFSCSLRQSLARLGKFNLTTGAFSILGNVLLMKLLVDAAHIQYLTASVLTIACCSIVNFLASERFVFSQAKG